VQSSESQHVASIFRVKEKPSKNQQEAYSMHNCLFLTDFLLGLHFDPEDRGDMFFRKAG
jgi:hypothetical protein